MRTLFAIFAVLAAATAQADSFAITGAKVHTVGPAGTLENAVVVVENGLVREVGPDAEIPAGATRIEADGKVVTPGLFTPVGQVGVVEVNAVSGTVDYIQRGDDFAASFDIADAFNPRSTLVPINRIEGITRAAITPEATSPEQMARFFSHVLSGLGAIVHLGGPEEPIVRRHAMLVANFGERGGSLVGGSRAAALLELRSAFEDARDYAANREAFERGARREYSVSRSDLEALADVLEDRIPLLAHADRASDIRVLVEFAAEFDLPLIVAGGAESWLVADELARADAAVVLSSVNNLPGSFDELNARLDTAALLEEAGVTFTFGSNGNMQTHNARNLTQAAGIAVANGLTWEAALRSITLTPAEIYGVADRLGSIEPGKEADLVVWGGDPLELTNYPEQVFIRGEAVPMQSRQTLLRDRYLDDAARPPAFRHPD